MRENICAENLIIGQDGEADGKPDNRLNCERDLEGKCGREWKGTRGGSGRLRFGGRGGSKTGRVERAE